MAEIRPSTFVEQFFNINQVMGKVKQVNESDLRISGACDKVFKTLVRLQSMIEKYEHSTVSEADKSIHGVYVEQLYKNLSKTSKHVNEIYQKIRTPSEPSTPRASSSGTATPTSLGTHTGTRSSSPTASFTRSTSPTGSAAEPLTPRVIADETGTPKSLNITTEKMYTDAEKVISNIEILLTKDKCTSLADEGRWEMSKKQVDLLKKMDDLFSIVDRKNKADVKSLEKLEKRLFKIIDNANENYRKAVIFTQQAFTVTRAKPKAKAAPTTKLESAKETVPSSVSEQLDLTKPDDLRTVKESTSFGLHSFMEEKIAPNFSMRKVTSDGDCMFNAVAVGLMQSTKPRDLRMKVRDSLHKFGDKISEDCRRNILTSLYEIDKDVKAGESVDQSISRIMQNKNYSEAWVQLLRGMAMNWCKEKIRAERSLEALPSGDLKAINALKQQAHVWAERTKVKEEVMSGSSVPEPILADKYDEVNRYVQALAAMTDKENRVYGGQGEIVALGHIFNKEIDTIDLAQAHAEGESFQMPRLDQKTVYLLKINEHYDQATSKFITR